MNSSSPPSRVLITGHRGFIGSVLLAALRQQGVVAEGLPGDVIDAAAAPGGFDTVVHLAARPLASPSSGQGFDMTALRSNLLGTQAVIDYACKNRCHIVFASSCAVYAPAAGGEGGARESDALAPTTIYGAFKLLAEEMIARAARDGAISAAVLRLFNVYGPGQREPFLIPYLLACGRRGETASLRNPEFVRDFVHVSDVVSAICTALDKREAGTVRVFNVGTGRGTRLRDLASLLESVLGRSIRFESSAAPSAATSSPEVPRMVADISAIRAALGWEPKIRLENGLRMLAGAADQPIES